MCCVAGSSTASGATMLLVGGPRKFQPRRRVQRKWLAWISLPNRAGSGWPRSKQTRSETDRTASVRSIAVYGAFAMKQHLDRVTAARQWLVCASLAVTMADLAFFILAPVFGYPLEYPQNLRVMQIVLPVTLGYLGSMTHFLFQTRAKSVRISAHAMPFLEILVKGPVVIFAVVSAAAIVAFGYANRRSALPGTGLSIDHLSLALTAALSLLTVCTNGVVAFLFHASHLPEAKVERP